MNTNSNKQFKLRTTATFTLALSFLAIFSLASCSNPLQQAGATLSSRATSGASLELFNGQGNTAQSGAFAIGARYTSTGPATIQMEIKNATGELLTSNTFDVEAGSAYVSSTFGLMNYLPPGTVYQISTYMYPAGQSWAQRVAEDSETRTVYASQWNDSLHRISAPGTAISGQAIPVGIELSSTASRLVRVQALSTSGQVLTSVQHNVEYDTDSYTIILDLPYPVGTGTINCQVDLLSSNGAQVLATRTLPIQLSTAAVVVKDSVQANTLPLALKSGESLALAISYTAPAARDILIDLYDQRNNWCWIAGTRVTVSASNNGSAVASLALPSILRNGAGFSWVIRMVSPGASYTSPLSNVTVSNVQANQAEFDMVQIIPTTSFLALSNNQLTVVYALKAQSKINTEIKTNTHQWLAGKQIQVSAGIGRNTVSISTNPALVANTSYQLYAYAFPLNGSWATRTTQTGMSISTQP
jgi:hypothetical protein